MTLPVLHSGSRAVTAQHSRRAGRLLLTVLSALLALCFSSGLFSMADTRRTEWAFSKGHGHKHGKTISAAHKPIISVVGSCNTDLTSYVDLMPKTGETRRGDGFKVGFGGKGANQAVMAGRLGAVVNFIGKLGTDSFGENTITNFKKNGIHWKGFFTDKAMSGVASITVDSTGDKSIVIEPGANNLLTEDEVRRHSEAITSSQVLLVQNEIPIAATRAALEIGRKAGVATVFNPAPVPKQASDMNAVLPFVDILNPNEIELQMLTGARETSTDEQVVEAARSLLSAHDGLKVVLVTLEERGTIIVTRDNVVVKSGVKVKQVDTVGVGGCFLGSFAYFYALDGDLEAAVEKAAIVRSLSATESGGQTSYPDRETALKFVEETQKQRAR